jgi:hypothetical protein
MTKPTTIPEAVEACADRSHPLPHPDTSHIIKSTAPRRRICWPCVEMLATYFATNVWVGLALLWLWIVIAGNF